MLYRLLGIIGPLRLVGIPNTLFVAGSATATAANILAHDALPRFGLVAAGLGYVAMSVMSLLWPLSVDAVG